MQGAREYFQEHSGYCCKRRLVYINDGTKYLILKPLNDGLSMVISKNSYQSLFKYPYDHQSFISVFPYIIPICFPILVQGLIMWTSDLQLVKIQNGFEM